MTSDTDSLGQDISQEELDFSDLFLYNLHEERFLTGTDNGDQASPHHNGTNSPSLPPNSFDDESSYYLSSSILSFPATDQVCEPSAEFNIHDITSKAEVMPAPSPRIEITPSGDSLHTQPLEVTSSSAVLSAYREQPSPACSNSSGGWLPETFSPGTSPCDSPNGGGGGLGLSTSDLSSGLQGFHTSSAHSSPGTSPRTSITEETFLVPQHQRSTSPLSHPQRCRSTSPQGKRTYDQCSSPSLGTPVKQRSRSPSPSPLTSDPQGPQLLQQPPYQPQVLAEQLQAPFHSTLEEMLNNLSSSLPKSLPFKLVRASDDACIYSEAPRKDCVYVDAPRKDCVYVDAPRKDCVYVDAPRKDCVYVDALRKDCVYVDAPKNDCVYVEMHGWGGEQERKIKHGAGAAPGIGIEAGARAGDEMGAGAGAGSGSGAGIRAGTGAGARAGAGAGAEVKVETFYAVTSGWHSTVAPVAHHPTTYGGMPLVFLPSLEWPLPSGSGQCELVVRQQPRPHHRAHYETEGSRGPVKTPSGGHPVVQLCGYSGASPLGLDVFIGTAEDERVLKPHAFYQVHRITGKTVTTASRERVINGTKVLEIPLETKNNMTAVIDCAGILKLRNADIELRNGETDIGRKNTRVRLVFRVHIPHPDGQLVSLQVASVPIECSQRSAQDLPDVEKQDLDRCSVLGGQQMMLTGQNFNCDSKVVFSEKTHDGQQIWEMEAIVDRNKSQSSVLFVEVPPYHNPAIYHPAKVNFYVINGKKKRSQPQHFTYTPLLVPLIKPEPVDDYQWCMSTSTGLPVNPYYQHIIPTSLDTNSQSRATPVTACHLKTLDILGPTYQLLDGAQPVQFPPRTSTTLSSSPIIYQAMNHQHPVSVTSLSQYSGSDAHLTEHKYGKAGQRESLQTPGTTSSQVRQHCQANVQTVAPLGQTPPPPAPVRSTHNQAYMGSPTPRGHNQAQQGLGTGCQHGLLPEKITIKQENLNPTYLEDVNDIIRRDLN